MNFFRRSANLLILFVLQVFITFKIWDLEGWGFGEGALRLGVICASLVLMVLLWNALLARLPRRLALGLNILFVFGYLALQGYHWLRHEPLTFLVLYKNGSDLFTPEAIDFVLSNFSAVAWLTIGVLMIALALLQHRYDIFGAFHTVHSTGRNVVLLLAANAAAIAAAPSIGNEYYELASSAYRYLRPANYAFESDALYPYLQTVPQEQITNVAKNPSRPHVFIVMLESFSANYMDRIENGQAVTPFLDELKHQGVFVTDFYSASVETSKGQFATLCSVYPAYRANVFTSYPNNGFRCLSHILKENGYINVFMKAFENLKFENTGNFVNANAFDYAHGMDDDFVTAAEREKYKFGWGIQDDVFYRKTFGYLDKLREKKREDSRFFVMTMSVTNHMMFDDIPLDQRFIYPKAASHQENYTNSMHLTDRYLREFFKQLHARDWLDNSLVVITGDNGFPMGQHDNYHNTKTGFNELFKTPLLILWGDKLTPTILEDRAYSQLDIAPTVLDLLGIKTTHHFVGQSIFAIDEDTHFVPLIQPFDGTWLSSIRHPLKLMKHQKTGKEFLYNIAEDPLETTNLIGSVLDLNRLEKLRMDIEAIKYNELLLEEDRIYPSASVDSFRIKVKNVAISEGEVLPFELSGQPNEDSKIHVTIKHLNPETGKIERNSGEPLSAVTGYVPANLFGPGMNQVSFKIRHGKRTLHTMTQQIYVYAEDAVLISALDVQGKQGWGRLGINTSVGGQQLRVNNQAFAFGLGTHAPSEHKIPLDGNFAWFETYFGLDDESRCGDGAVFEIWADGKQLYKSPTIKRGAVKKALVAVSGYQELRLVTHEGKTKGCDHADWLNPVLYR